MSADLFYYEDPKNTDNALMIDMSARCLLTISITERSEHFDQEGITSVSLKPTEENKVVIQNMIFALQSWLTQIEIVQQNNV